MSKAASRKASYHLFDGIQGKRGKSLVKTEFWLAVFRYYLVLVLLCSGLMAIAQPGPFGGRFGFALYHNGKNVVSDSGYVSSLHYNGLKNLYYRNLIREQDKFWLDAEETPVGGHLPDDFTICIAHKGDTMQLLGANSYVSFGTYKDSIPFLPGRYHLPGVIFSGLKVAPGIRLLNFGWPCLNADSACANLTYLPEKVNGIKAQAAELRDLKVQINENGNSVLIRDTITNLWRTIFMQEKSSSTFGVFFKAAQHGQTLVLYNLFTLWISTDYGKSWSRYVPDELYRSESEYRDKKREFILDAVFFIGNTVYAVANRSFGEFNNFARDYGVFRLHLDTDQNPDRYSAMRDKVRNEITNLIDNASKANRKELFERVMLGNQSFKQFHRPGYFKKATLFWYENYFLTVITMDKGKYNLSKQLVLPNLTEKKPVFYSNGTYTFNDSTITFTEKDNLFNGGVDSLIGLKRPTGKIYYCWAQNYVSFYEFDEKYPVFISYAFQPSLKSEEELIEERLAEKKTKR